MTMLKGMSAIVTGSTSGIGLAIANRLAADGANVMLNGFGKPEEIAAIQKDISSRHGVRTAYSAADMTKPAEIKQMIANAEAEFGSVDILVNNAGIQFVAPIEQFPEEKWDAIIAINMSAVFHATKAALPGMKKRNFGRIVNIASAHGLVASADKAAYVTAKHGVVGFTKVAALETAEFEITVNAICPGWVDTPLVRKQIEDRAAANKTSIADETKNLIGEKQPNKRFTTPEQVAELAAFLCRHSSNAITGTTHSIDGGWTAW